MNQPELVRLSDAGHFSKVQLVAPEVKGFVLAAVEIDYRPPFAYFLESAAKRRIIKDLRSTLASLKASRVIDDATLLKAIIVPPGRGVYLKKRPDALRLRCRSPRRKRLVGYAPHGHRKIITFVAWLCLPKMTAPFVLEAR
jgi:hypothetical protein